VNLYSHSFNFIYKYFCQKSQ